MIRSTFKLLKPINSNQLRNFSIVLKCDTNQVQGLIKYAKGMINNPIPFSDDTKLIVKQFHLDSVMCGLSAMSLNCRAPIVLMRDSLRYQSEVGAFIMGTNSKVAHEKAIVVNSCAVREWDSNGTNFGYNEDVESLRAGEFGHNDFYPVVQAAADSYDIGGPQQLASHIVIDEIRGRLAESFSLKSYKIDHVMHGAISSAIVQGILTGLSEEQIESAVGMVVAHQVPFRAIRAGHQISDSKGASAAISTEAAITACNRARQGFIGPADIFRNPQSLFRLNEPTQGDTSPFEIQLATEASDKWSIGGMHFKMGLQEHQSAGAIHSILKTVEENPFLLDDVEGIDSIDVKIQEPAQGIICDPAKLTPATRQSADHSLYFIIATLLKNVNERKEMITAKAYGGSMDYWVNAMLMPTNQNKAHIQDSFVNTMMRKINLVQGGPEQDAQQPDGIPTSVQIGQKGQKQDSGFVNQPFGHNRNEDHRKFLLQHKWSLLGKESGISKDQVSQIENLMMNVENMGSEDLRGLQSQDKLKVKIEDNASRKQFDD